MLQYSVYSEDQCSGPCVFSDNFQKDEHSGGSLELTVNAHDAFDDTLTVGVNVAI